MNQIKQTLLVRAAVCGFVFSLLCSSFSAAAAGESLSESVIRLHVVANSDSEGDQAIKLLVRDAVLQQTDRWQQGAETLEEATTALCTHLDSIRLLANRVLRENGCEETVTVQLTNEYFSTRHYENFTFPAGVYRTLKITIGAGEGHNWWCVAFPSLCLPAAEETELEKLSPAQQKFLKNSDQYRVRLKLTEWYESLRKSLDFH